MFVLLPESNYRNALYMFIASLLESCTEFLEWELEMKIAWWWWGASGVKLPECPLYGHCLRVVTEFLEWELEMKIAWT